MSEAAIGWHELIVLMAFGRDGADVSVRGTMHYRDVWAVPGDDADEPFVEHPELGRMRVSEGSSRVLARGRLVRVERADGDPTMIFGADATWLFGTDPPTRYDPNVSSFGWQGAELVTRIPPSRWEGEDFTHLTGAIRATTFLGRAAWEFELAPPRHKPYPLQMTVDAETGMLLRQANRDFGSVIEWTDVEFGAELPDELFRWDGPTQPEPDRDAEHERDLAERRSWLDAHGLGAIPLPVRQEVHAHEHAEDGTVHLSVRAYAHASVVRRPHSDAAWAEEHGMHYPKLYEWSDQRWDWRLGTDQELGEDDLREMKDVLARST